MYKILLMSILLATVLVPAMAARDSQPRRGLKRAVWGMLLFNLLYELALIYVYPRICW